MPRNKRRVPLGPPLSAGELALLARLTPADVTAASATWRRRAPRPLADLLDATAPAPPVRMLPAAPLLEDSSR